MPRYVVTFDLDSSGDPDYRAVDEVMGKLGLYDFIQNNENNFFSLPFNTYCGFVARERHAVYNSVRAALETGLGYTVPRLFVAEYEGATFKGPRT